MCTYVDLKSVVQEEMWCKDISYLEFWQPFCSSQRNHFCNCGARHYKVSKGAKIRNRYNQVPHLIQDTNDTNRMIFLTITPTTGLKTFL